MKLLEDILLLLTTFLNEFYNYQVTFYISRIYVI